jgi:acyl-coenzyme A thioesterase PaaI-like protein
MVRKASPRSLRFLMNLWPPYLGAGIRVRKIAADYREVQVELRPGLFNRGYFGTHFGGSLYAMADPFFSLMVLKNLPANYLVWDKSASIEYVAPGRGRVRARFVLTQHDLDTILRMTAEGDKHLHLFRVDVEDSEGLVVARIEKIVYVRKKKSAAGSAAPGDRLAQARS